MKIDILSDLHFDNYFYNKYSKDDVIKFYSQIIDFNKDYFMKCMKIKLSPYKALLFFSDYLIGEYEI